MLKHMAENLNIFACPSCRGSLAISEGEIQCLSCKRWYGTESGIPLLYCSGENSGEKKTIADVVKAFYEKTPFPNYESNEKISDLVRKAELGYFARMMNEQIPFNIRVLEVGCGTGQLSNYLGVAQRYVFGTDACLNSLKLASAFSTDNGLLRVGFYQMNLFKPIFKDESFSLVICNGVLHHTGSPYDGFRSIARLVKKRGYIVIGLYNKYGRTVTNIRRLLFHLFGDRFKNLDPRVGDMKDEKKRAWFLDQYKNPHESQHSIGEVLSWFKKTGFSFVNSIPKARILDPFTTDEKIFEQSMQGNSLDHFIVQVKSVITGADEGGLFIMIGRKN